MTAKYLKSLSKSDVETFFSSFDVVLSDCDGVLWRETESINGSPETVEKLVDLGKKFVYVTNNNGKTRAELVNKCRSFTYAATEEQIICASYLVALYLSKQNFKKKVYLIGNESFAKELEAEGIEVVGVGPDVIDGDELDSLTNFKVDPDVGAVVVGLDKHFSYPKLVKAATYAQNPDVLFIGANPDIERPSPNGNKFPEAGCLIKAIEMASGREALILGKPETFIAEVIEEKYGVSVQDSDSNKKSRTLMIGDSLKTDITLGKRSGFITLLVLSGITSIEDLKNADDLMPDYYTDQLSDVLSLLKTIS